ncbi:PTPRE-like protein [Mya arenaria]|uniref:PTPRE-like protein n=1 Tax=Mya arenaria TaxID=6604 RepID=A0ABY7DPA1_MYAAR|nr:PTPRE-like protein [Mya arenaria]
MENQFTLPFNPTPDTNSYPTDGIFDIRFSATQARYVRLILKRTSITPKDSYPIVICEVEVFGPNGRNSDLIQTIQKNVTVDMGKALVYGNLTYPKENAIDDNPRTDPDLCDCCSTTAEGWWTIDLGKEYLIQAIQIIGRSDGHGNQTKPFTVSVGTVSLGQMTSSLTEVYSGDPNQGNYAYFITLLPVKVIKVIKVWKKTPPPLTICEFKVYGLECIDGHFGKGCQSKGFCNGTYDMATGECPSCLSGYKGNTCSKACDKGFFGPYCKYACGNCSPGSTCSAQTGHCPKGCDNGFKGVFCKQSCDNNTYGKNCASHCGHCSTFPCDTFYGTCTGQTKVCELGFLPPKCDTECLDETYGEDCRSNCSRHCSNGDICSKKNGLCLNGCLLGYNFTGDRLCLTECIHGTYGLNCAENCGHCRDGLYCNTHNGYCMAGCARGYRGVKCEDGCPNGLYGYDCAFSCHCKSEEDMCDPENGSCFNGCAIGWGGQNCSSDLSIIKHDSHGVNAVQNSTYLTCNASNTFNGKTLMHATDNDTLLCQACSATTETTDPWLQIDLGQMFSVGYIRVYGRGGNQQSSNLFLSASNVSLLTSDGSDSIANITNASISGTIVELPLPRTFQYLVIRKTGVSVMSICEIGLYGKECPSDGSFGDRCRSSCHCRDSEKCNILTGKCTSPGCFQGWRGIACNICKLLNAIMTNYACLHNKFGRDCSETCHCYGDGECDQYNGTCKANKCEPGWRTASCDAECGNGTFGDDCESICNCAQCHHVNGSCSLYQSSCFDGYEGDTCSKLKIQNHVNVGAIAGGTVAAIVNDDKSFKKQPVKEGDYYSFNDAAPGIEIHLLWNYITEKMKNTCKHLYDEFATLTTGLVHKHDVAAQEKNKGKNRYKEMYAYDHSRVPLQTDKPDESDYINACFINGYEKVNKFIASQGPTKNMIDDFWRMIWQQKADKIVMLTNLIEMASTGSKPRRIRQFHFKTWPDKDVPDSAWCLVDFWKAVDTNSATNESPIVVHCSAGVGRTGTFIALDNLIYQAKAEKCVRLLQMVQTLRRQRVNMVQTKEQYVYLHEAVAEALLIGTHHVYSKQFDSFYKHMVNKELRSPRTRIEEQFDLIEKGVTEESVQEVGPEYGNIESMRSEIDAYRPNLNKRGSNFVQNLGTIFLPNYANKNTFLVAMSPTEQTLEEFWSLIEEQHITTLIMLTPQSHTAYKVVKTCQYLGSMDGKQIGNFVVNCIHEKKNKEFQEKCFSFKDVNNEDEDYLTTIRQFEFSAWREGEDTPTSVQPMLDMLEAVNRWQPHLLEKRPILIHCESGFHRSGLIAVLLNEFHRIQANKGQINIVESVKTMKQRNKDIVQSPTQLRYIYNVIQEHVKQMDVYQNM